MNYKQHDLFKLDIFLKLKFPKCSFKTVRCLDFFVTYIIINKIKYSVTWKELDYQTIQFDVYKKIMEAVL